MLGRLAIWLDGCGEEEKNQLKKLTLFVFCLFFGFDTVKMINVRRDFLSLQETAVWAIVDHTTFSDLSFLSRLVRF